LSPLQPEASLKTGVNNGWRGEFEEEGAKPPLGGTTPCIRGIQFNSNGVGMERGASPSLLIHHPLVKGE